MATVLQCVPVSRAWNRWSGNGICVNLGVLWFSNAVYNIITDFIIVLMVPPVILTLQLPLRQKLALIGVFGLGLIVCTASITRMTTLYSSAYGTDVMAGSFVSTIWTTVEAGLGVICTNLPMLRTPLQHFFPRLFPTSTGTNQVSSRRGSRPSCRSNGETLASPTRLIPPPVPTHNVSRLGRAPEISRATTPPPPSRMNLGRPSRLADCHDVACEHYFGHFPWSEPATPQERNFGWCGH